MAAGMPVFCLLFLSWRVDKSSQGWATPAGSAIAGRPVAQDSCTRHEGNPGPQQEISLISYPAVLDISEIKLIRTDTTLDLSQKAEKVWRGA